MDLSNDLISKFVKITNDDKNENSESTVYGTVVEYNGGMYVRIDGSDLLTPVETTADFKPNERVTVMIKNHSATVTGNITSPATNEGAVTEKVTKAVEDVEGKVITEVEILIADRVSTKQLDAEVARIDELIAGKASVEDLTATNAEITNLKADKASIKDLTATNAEITNLKAKDAEIENLVAGKATVEDLTATNAEITNLKAKDAEIENLVADKARIEDLTATNARIDSLQANKADITYLDANFATIDELEATNADIEVLDAEVADINTLVNGNLTSDNILSLNITSQNTTMENAFVKDAMIDTVTANKIMSGTIDTNKVTIQSTDGSMLLQGTLLQMKDDNGKVRIQIGKDTGGNFTFILYDESGTGVLIDEEGIKSSDAIADGLIVDAKVADNANIAGSKLNIASVITEVNKDNSTTIKSNKIYLDEQGQSLEVAFNSLKTHVDTIQDVTIDGDLTVVKEQVQSNTTQITANKEGISTLVSENTIRKEEIQNLDGEIESVNNTLSSKYSSLEQDVSGFKTTVADTYTTKSEFNNLQIGGKNLLLDSKRETSNNAYYIDEFRPTELFEVGEIYTVSICVTPANGVTHIQPFTSGGYMGLSNPLYVNGATKQVVSISFTFNGYNSNKVPVDIYDYNAFVQIFRFPEDGTVTSNTTLHWVKLEKGNKATDWSPAPEDVQGQIDATNDNLQNNYSTTSAMNSAIQQKANEITSTVSQTYTTKSEFNNLQIGGKNLLLDSKRETSNNGYCIDQFRPTELFEVGEIYTMSICVTPANGVTYIHPYASRGNKPLSNGLVVNGATKQVISITFTFDGYHSDNVPVDISDSNAFVQIYRFPNDGTVTGNTTLHWVKIEKGAKATDWSPAPEDVQGQIDATNNNLSANYSTTSAMNSAIQQKANEITSSVSQTYATKQSVTDVSNNLTTNYSTTSAMNSAIQQKANEITSSVSETYTTKSEFNGLQIGGVNLVLWSECIELDASDHGNNDNSIIENNTVKITPMNDGNAYNYAVYTSETRLQGETYTLSFDILSPDDIGFYWYPSESYSIDDKIKASSKWQTVSFTYTQWGETTANPVLFGFHRLIAGHVYYYRRLKLEKGNKPTAWSPAPEDVQGQIDATNDNLQNNYSTTSAMNSAIQQKANEITSTVSQTYTTKSEFNNLQIGGRNLATLSNIQGYAGGNLLINNNNYYSVEGTKIIAKNQPLNSWLIGFKVYTDNSFEYTVSGYTDMSLITVYFKCYDKNDTVVQDQLFHTKTVVDGKFIVSFSNIPKDTYYFHIGIGNEYTANYFIDKLKIEKGNKATDWSPAPEDIQGQIDATNNNLQNNYSTTSAMNSAIQQKANEITSSVSQTYATKQSVTDINNNLANNYSTTSQMNSAIQQKANEITSSVSQTYISNYEAKKLADTTTTGLNMYLFERYQRDGFDYGTRPTLNDLVGARLIESQLVGGSPGHTSSLGDNYIGVLTFYLYYDYACTKTSIITTDDHGTVYLNNVAIYELTSCIQANVTFNMSKGLNRIDIIYAEGGGGDGVSWGGVDGWSAFGAYANVVTNEIANRTNELTLAMTQGNMLYTDPTFRSGNNGVEIYNNLGNWTVSRERIAAIEGCPNTSGYCIKITTNGEATPGLGGFYFGNMARRNAVFITKITAKIPIGYTIEWASNGYGNNGERKWLSYVGGTGDWHDYYFKVKCGDSGDFSSTNYFYLIGPQAATAENPVTWYISYATVFDVTDSDERITNLTNNLAVNYSTTSQMNSAIQQKANEITSSVSQTYTTKAEFNNLSNNLTTNYSTTSQMNSAIQQKANEITSSVSQTYATKQSVTDVNNNLVNNYSTTSQMNTAIQQKANEITSSVGQTYITKSEAAMMNDTVVGNRKWLFEQYTNNQNVGTGNGTYPTLAHLANETLTSSRLVDSLPGSASELGSNYLGVYTVYLYYESAYTWSGSITSDDESTTYLNGVAVCQAPTCISTPFTMNFKKGINKLQIIHGEGGGGDGVTLSDLGPWKEYGAYPACVTAASSNYYASNSDIVQTANDLTIKFTESGGYNLLQNGHADKGTSYWFDNGGGIRYHANAGGGATGNFFGTDLPHGIGYYDWVKLLPNTHYVYQAKIWSNAAFGGDSSVPLHYWFSYDTTNQTGDGYTILDYQQNVQYTGTWTQCYVHFVTGNSNIFFKPYIWHSGVTTSIYVTEIMLSQSRVVQPWSPHPSEVYSGITQIDKDGIKVQHNNANGYTHMTTDGFFINRNGADVLYATSNGLYVQGNITSGSTIQGARITGSTFNSSNDVFQVLEDGTIETSFLAVNGAVSTDKLNVNDIENASYPKVLSEATTVYISPNGGVNAEEFYDGAYFTSLSNMLAVAPRNLNGYTLTIRMAGDLYENAALTWFHSGQVNFEMQGHTLYGYFYGYGASMCYRLYGNTNANNNGTWGHIKPNVGRAMGSYYYAVQFQYCQFAVNYVAVYPSSSSGSSSGGIGVHRGATGIIFNAKACGDMRYLVRAEYAGRVHVNATQGACNNATFCASTGGIITLNSSNNQAGRSTTGNPYWVGSGGLILCDQLLGMDKITFNNTSQSGSSSSSGSTTRKVTETIKASSADTYRSTVYNNWKGDGTVRQGDYGYGDCQGCWFFGNNLYTTMNAGTVTKVVIRMQRQSGGVNAAQTLTVKSHNHTSRPSGAPTYTDTIGTCSCAVGSYIDLVITDSTTINKLKNCKGLGLSIGSASSPYAVCSGACSVIITYTTNG